MGEEDIFVKRVDFEENNNQTNPINSTNVNGNAHSDVEKLAESDAKPTCCSKFNAFLDKFGLKSALSHLGLLFSLGLFCLGGGWVNAKCQ